MRRNFTAIILSSFLIACVLSGCAFGTYGTADMTYSKITVPEGIVGRDKMYILKTLGVPDSVARVRDAEYWDYGNKCGYTILLFGKTLEKDLILDIRNERVRASFLVDKGSSAGIFPSEG